MAIIIIYYLNGKLSDEKTIKERNGAEFIKEEVIVSAYWKAPLTEEEFNEQLKAAKNSYDYYFETLRKTRQDQENFH